MAGEESADWAEEEGKANRKEGNDGGQAAFQRAEHELVEYEASYCGVEEVVVPLDGGTDGGRGDNTAAFGRRDCRGGSCLRHVFPF